ncbi:MAG: NADPH-dependent glutamate synthase [Lachnospirales bacterium]
MSPEKVPMPEQPGNVRNKNYEEVTLGYTEEMAIEEATRCLGCKHKPCVEGCPVNVRIPEFIRAVAFGKFEEAFDIITSTNSLPAVCGRVCPQETQCEERCVRAIKGESVGIGRLERFVADWNMANVKKEIQKPQSNGKKVAILGGGPSGLTCASDLAKLGYDVTVFEAFHTIGGVLIYGIPEFRLPKAIVAKEVDTLKALGVKFELNTIAGRAVSIDELKEEGFEAIYIATGAGLPSFMNIEGEGLLGVYSANEYLTRINLMKAYKEEYETPIQDSKKIAVVGGGNVAMDAARCAKRTGAEEVSIVYRRDRAGMPARLEEIHHAEDEAVELKLLTNPVRIIGDENGKVVGLECVKMELGEPDESGRRSPKTIEGSNFVIDVDTVIMSIGTRPNPLIANMTEGLDTNKKGCIVVDDKMKSTVDSVYAGGDATVGAATVIYAMGCGKTAAHSIHESLS